MQKWMWYESLSSAIWELRKKSRVFSRRTKPNHPPTYKLNKYVIWIFRIPNDKDLRKQKVFKNSKPCNHCIEQLLKMGFSKCCYSDDNNDIIQVDLRNTRNYYTRSYQNTKNLCK